MTAPEARSALASGALGAAAGWVVRLPMWPLTGSIAGAAIMHALVSGSSSAPSWWGVLAQVLVGAAVGAGIAGLTTAYLLARQRFAGKSLFEFGTMLSFAIPGTVIGVAYILAFNVPPVELTGTGVILVLCFVFRNMPVGVRAGIAALSQIDRSLDEASLTLGARTGTTMRRVVAPLLERHCLPNSSRILDAVDSVLAYARPADGALSGPSP